MEQLIQSPRLAIPASPTLTPATSPPPSPPHSLATSLGTHDSSISSAASDSTDRLSVSSSSFTTSAITSRKVSEDSNVPLEARKIIEDEQQPPSSGELRDVFSSSPSYVEESDVPNSPDSSSSAQSDAPLALVKGRRRSSAAETGASEDTFYSARTTRTVSRASMNLPMRSGAGREWRESQKLGSSVSGSVEEGNGGSTVSPSGTRESLRLSRMRAGSLSSSGGSIPQPIWLDQSSSPSSRQQASVRQSKIGEVAAAFDATSFTMATLRGMDKLEIHFVVAGLKASLDKASWDKEGLVEALEESRTIARSLQKVRLHFTQIDISLIPCLNSWSD